ncbi:MAG: ABC transporter ATP-binding protein [Neomegalonema sp.]|nr:ABC transporter ATP-binding protein [Neomegalonema sp.]
MGGDALIAEGLTFDYDNGRALHAASLTAPKGEITALVGPNGAGKTTVMRILAGLMRPQSGRAEVLGVDVAHDPRAVHQMVGYLPDFIGLWDGTTVARHLEHAGRCVGLSGAEAKLRAEKIAETLRLTEKLDADAGALSRGQRQRVALAQALMKKPKVLILDEPASGLDPEARKGLSELLRALKDGGSTLLVSSHILSELDDYSDHVVVIRGGRIVRHASLTAEETTQRIEVAFVGADNLSAALAAALPGRTVRVLAPDRAEVEAPAAPEIHAEILAQLIAAGLKVAAFSPRRRRLQDAYFETETAEDAA